MSLESVRAFFAEKAPDIEVIELPVETATVALAAAGARRRAGPHRQDVVAAGAASATCWWWPAATRGSTTASSRTCSAARRRCSTPEQVLALTGHPVGGVCPFGLATPLPVYCDISLRAFDEVDAGCRRPAHRRAHRARTGWPTGRRHLGGRLPGCRVRADSPLPGPA